MELALLDRPQANVVGLVRDGEVDFGLALESIMTKRLREQWMAVDREDSDEGLRYPKNRPFHHSLREFRQVQAHNEGRV
jgi:hypothetical protein